MSRPTMVEAATAQVRLEMSAPDTFCGADDPLGPADPPEPLEPPHAASTPGNASAAVPRPSPRSN